MPNGCRYLEKVFPPSHTHTSPGKKLDTAKNVSILLLKNFKYSVIHSDLIELEIKAPE